jgi:aspartate aminotransferase
MALISQRISNMPPSETLAMTQIANELAEAGKDVIKLSIGEPDFNTPEMVKEAAKTAIDENWTHYPPVPGYPDLKKAICAKFKRDNNLDFTPDQIVVSTGGKQAIYQVVMSLVDPGDEVVIPTPFWVSYKAIVQLAEGKSVYIQTKIENDFKVTPDQLRAALTPKTKMMIFSSPSNPTGMLYSRDELKALAEVLRDYPNVIVLSDEIYEHINFEGKHESMAQFDWMKDRTVTVNGVPKASP